MLGESNASTVEGGNWMALRQKKANERKDLERQKRGQELKEKRKNQTEALRVRNFVERHSRLIFTLFMKTYFTPPS